MSCISRHPCMCREGKEIWQRNPRKARPGRHNWRAPAAKPRAIIIWKGEVLWPQVCLVFCCFGVHVCLLIDRPYYVYIHPRVLVLTRGGWDSKIGCSTYIYRRWLINLHHIYGNPGVRLCLYFQDCSGGSCVWISRKFGLNQSRSPTGLSNGTSARDSVPEK